MKMTIDEAIKIIDSTINQGASKIDCALATAIAILRKYQKIQTIVDMNVNYGHYVKEMKLSAISRVVHGKKQEEQLWKFLDEVESEE